MQWISHRGESLEAPENTLSAVNLSWKKDADGIEIDVHLSADNKLVAIHDSDTSRVSTINATINQTPYPELKTIDVGSWKGPEFKDEKIPLLEDLLATVPEDKTIFIELKTNEVGVIPALESALEGFTGKYYVISFDFNLMCFLKKNFPQHQVMWSIKERIYRKLPKTEIFARARENGFCGVTLEYSSFVSPKLLSEFNALKLKTVVWTVDDEAVAQKLSKTKLDYLISNKAGALKNS